MTSRAIPQTETIAVTDPFLIRAAAGAIGLAIVAAPLGALVIWNRMAYFGETVAQASLLGVALGLGFGADLNLAIAFVAAAVAALLILVSRQKVVPMDSLLGLMHHGLLALGVIAASLLKGPSVDLMGFLFGDIFAISSEDLLWIYSAGAFVLLCLYWLWQHMLRLAVNDELAGAEGLNATWIRAAFIMLLALTIALSIKIAGVLLAIAFLLVPVVAARPLAATPESMAGIAAVAGIAGVLSGLTLSFNFDLPGGPTIVLSMTALAACSLAYAALRGKT
jgi:zinc transport system permease protein